MADLTMETCARIESQKQHSRDTQSASAHQTEQPSSSASIRSEDADEQMDDNDSSDTEMFVTPPESDDDEKLSEPGEKSTSTGIPGSTSRHITEPTEEPHFIQPDRSSTQLIKQTETPVLVLRSPNEQYPSAPNEATAEGSARRQTDNGSDRECSSWSKELTTAETSKGDNRISKSINDEKNADGFHAAEHTKNDIQGSTTVHGSSVVTESKDRSNENNKVFGAEASDGYLAGEAGREEKPAGDGEAMEETVSGNHQSLETSPQTYSAQMNHGASSSYFQAAFGEGSNPEGQYKQADVDGFGYT